MSRKFILTIIGSVLVIKIIFAIFFPVLADEAYYFAWALHPAGGYYDLPPMIAWWLQPYRWFHMRAEWFRVIFLFAHFATAGMIYFWLKKTSPAPAALAALLILVSPVLCFNVFAAPDWPFVFFYTLCGIVFYQAQEKQCLSRAFLAGLILGLSFLSKYFAITFFPVALVYLWMTSRSWKIYAALVIGFLPALVQHVDWNLNHCLSNFTFNFLTRQEISDGSFFQTFGLFLVYLLLTATPVLIWSAMKEPQKSSDIQKFALLQFLIPMLLFGLSAIKKGQGLHWYMAYVPWFIVWISFRIQKASKTLRKAFLWWTLHALIVIAFFLAPVSVIKSIIGEKRMFDYEFANKRQIPIALLASTNALVSDTYSYASILDLAQHEAGFELPVGVIAKGNRFGRSFDFWINWKSLNTKKITWIGREEPQGFLISDFFEHAEKSDLVAPAQAIIGSGFKTNSYIAHFCDDILNCFYPRFSFERACSLRDQWKVNKL